MVYIKCHTTVTVTVMGSFSGTASGRQFFFFLRLFRLLFFFGLSSWVSAFALGSESSSLRGGARFNSGCFSSAADCASLRTLGEFTGVDVSEISTDFCAVSAGPFFYLSI